VKPYNEELNEEHSLHSQINDSANIPMID